MPLKIRPKLTTATCGHCGKRVGPFGHDCRRSMTRKARKTRYKVRATPTLFRCPRCGEEYANPVTHTCKVRSDFAKRRRAAERKKATARRAEERQARRRRIADARRRAAAQRKRKARVARRDSNLLKPKHRYQTCRDDDCPRYGCVAYKAGFQAGYQAGFAAGRAKGLAEGYKLGHQAGFSDGYQAGYASGSAAAG
jgi:hypothetical protein